MNLSKHHPPSPQLPHTAATRRQKLDAFLLGLATDDDLRAAFVAEPVKVLEAHGLNAEPDQIPPRRRLPSKQEIAAVREKMLAESESELTFFTFLLFPPSKKG